MRFPVWISVGPTRVHPHLLFEVLAYVVGFCLYLVLRRRQGDEIDNSIRWSLVTAVFVGAVVGGRGLAWLDQPGGKTLVGALLGGWIATELTKRRLGIRQPTGDVYVLPLVIGIAIGRIGCLLTGLSDGTYGVSTSLPWGVDFGDGVHRHPTALYESLFMAALVLPLRRFARGAARGDLFKAFMATYLGFRLLVDMLKPAVPLALGLTGIQWACLAGLAYYAWWFSTERTDAWQTASPR